MKTGRYLALTILFFSIQVSCGDTWDEYPIRSKIGSKSINDQENKGSDAVLQDDAKEDDKGKGKDKGKDKDKDKDKGK